MWPQLVSMGIFEVPRQIGHDIWLFWLRLYLTFGLGVCSVEFAGGVGWGGALANKCRNPSMSFTESVCNCGFNCCTVKKLLLLR